MADSFTTRSELLIAGAPHPFFDLGTLARRFPGVAQLPNALKILLENLLRHEDGRSVRPADIEALASWDPAQRREVEIAFMPARVLLQDFTGVPAIADLAAMREAMHRLGGDPQRINPLQPVDLVIDHSVQVDRFATASAFAENVALEFERNAERYRFLRWGQRALDNFRVVPPGTGICHQVNLEYLGQVVVSDEQGALCFDTLVGTDSHTPMINGLGVLGWGVGGIEAEAAMLGQPLSMLIPDVIGFELTGALRVGTTATDLVLTVAQLLRAKGVVGTFIEFFGAGLDQLPVADRATIANMTPEFGATSSLFPVDQATLDYLRFSGRSEALVQRVEAYCRAQGTFRTSTTPVPRFSDRIALDLSTVVPSIAGPRRPHDRVPLTQAKSKAREAIASTLAAAGDQAPRADAVAELTLDGRTHQIGHGAVAIAAITSCTNTSNPAVMIGAGLLARNAVARGLSTRPWVKTSLAPGSQVVTDYLVAADLMRPLEALGFHLVGYGCTTCIGNSGPLPPPVSQAVEQQQLVVAAVLSGNRNFEGRINPQVQLSYLASPPLVVAYALAGSVDVDLDHEPLGHDASGAPVYLRDLWPTPAAIAATTAQAVRRQHFVSRYAAVFEGDQRWRELSVPAGSDFQWDDGSTYVRRPPFFDDVALEPAAPADLIGARCLALLGDSVTTDHISPAGGIARQSPAAHYLQAHGVALADFNQYGARRGNHEVMVRGTFANIRLRNGLVPGVEGGVTRLFPSGEQLPIYDAAMRYQSAGVPLVVIAGSEYGSGSSRDWAAKGPRLLGVRAVIAKSFERIHRSNLVGMGILPLQFAAGQDAASLGLAGDELYDVVGVARGLQPAQQLTVRARRSDGSVCEFGVIARLDTPNEVDYHRHGGILLFVLRQLLRQSV